VKERRVRFIPLNTELFAAENLPRMLKVPVNFAKGDG
jgi:hypothetical protein